MRDVRDEAVAGASNAAGGARAEAVAGASNAAGRAGRGVGSVGNASRASSA